MCTAAHPVATKGFGCSVRSALADDRALGFLVDRKRCELAERDRRGWKSLPEIPDLLRRNAARLRDQLGDGEPTHSPLARTHAATKIRLDLIRSGRALRCRIDDLLRGHLFATACNRRAFGY